MKPFTYYLVDTPDGYDIAFWNGKYWLYVNPNGKPNMELQNPKVIRPISIDPNKT